MFWSAQVEQLNNWFCISEADIFIGLFQSSLLIAIRSKTRQWNNKTRETPWGRKHQNKNANQACKPCQARRFTLASATSNWLNKRHSQVSLSYSIDVLTKLKNVGVIWMWRINEQTNYSTEDYWLTDALRQCNHPHSLDYTLLQFLINHINTFKQTAIQIHYCSIQYTLSTHQLMYVDFESGTTLDCKLSDWTPYFRNKFYHQC